MLCVIRIECFHRDMAMKDPMNHESQRVRLLGAPLNFKSGWYFTWSWSLDCCPHVNPVDLRSCLARGKNTTSQRKWALLLKHHRAKPSMGQVAANDKYCSCRLSLTLSHLETKKGFVRSPCGAMIHNDQKLECPGTRTLEKVCTFR